MPFPSCDSSYSRPLLASLVLATVIAVAGSPKAATAQDMAVPDRSYFATVEELYRGEYQDAERGMRNEVRGGIRIGLTHWVDSICYRAMLGEVYYQLGDHPRALVEFDAASELFLSYPRWLIAVEFRQPPRPDGNPARRLAPWGRPARQVAYATFPDTMLVQQGEMITEQRLQQGGALQTLQMWRVNVIEVLRCTALAIRRRNEILGPLGKHDRMSKNLVDALARGDNTQRNHWSLAWTEVLHGLAQQGIGESQQALAHLNRGLRIDGRYDHPLTGVALLAQASIALESGNAPAAVKLATEASYAAFAYEDLDVIAASLDLGHQAFMASGSEGIYAPLNVAAQWADREGLDHIVASALIDEAEELAVAGQGKLAAGRLGSISARRRDLKLGRLGPPRRYVEAFIAYVEGNIPFGDKLTSEALHARRASIAPQLSNRAHQRADRSRTSLFANCRRCLRHAAPRPHGRRLAREPLETLTNLATSHEAALGRWMVAALSREEVMPAINITDIAKRRRFWLAQPAGGRLLAIRHLLEAEPNRLPADAAVERRNLLLRVPEYNELLKQAAELERQLAAAPLADDEGRVPQERYANLKRLANNSEKRELLIRRLLLRRDATDLLVPPPVTAEAVQAQLKPAQAVVVFHQSATSFFAFVITQEAYHQWRLPEEGPLAAKTAEMLQAMGHFSASRTLDSDDLALDAWQPVATQYGDLLFADSRLDLSATSELILVPDGVLWHVPFEALQPSTGGNQQALIDRTPMRCVPTLGYAPADRFAPSPIRTTIVAAATGTGADNYLPKQAATELAETVANAAVIDAPIAAASSLVAGLAEQIVVLADAEISPGEPYAFSPLPIDRSARRGGAQHVVSSADAGLRAFDTWWRAYRGRDWPEGSRSRPL